jgi:hypothetical protein
MMCNIEREIFKEIDLEKIKKSFQKKREIEKCNYLGCLDAIEASLPLG